MNLSEIFIRRPIMTTLVMLGILLFGLLAYRTLPVSDLPNVDYPTISVVAMLPGASPETMASAVATPLERQFSTIAGLDNMTSSSAMGFANITLQFTLEKSLDAAAQDVQSNITAASRLLPPGMPAPPSYQKVNPADQPILYMSVSTLLSLSQLDEYAENVGAADLHRQGRAKPAFGARSTRSESDPRALFPGHPDRRRERSHPVGERQSPDRNLGTSRSTTVMAATAWNAGWRHRGRLRDGAPVRLWT